MKILWIGGKTLGHVNPIIGILSKLKESEKKECFYLGIKGSNESSWMMLYLEKNHFLELSAHGTKKSIFRLFLIFFEIIKNIVYGIYFIKKYEIDVIFSSGGTLTLPISISAKICHKSIYLHEQNIEIGLSNKLSLRYCKKMFLSFPLEEKNSKFKVVGNPCIDILYRRKTYFPYIENKERVLIVSGSLGARDFNKKIVEAIPKLLELYQVIWVTGKKYYSLYKDLQFTGCSIYPFLPNLYSYLCETDYIISRAGASTLYEIVHTKKMSVLIPSKNVSRNHQVKNASYFEKRMATVVLQEEDISATSLISCLKKAYCLQSSFSFALTKLDFESPAELIMKEMGIYHG